MTSAPLYNLNTDAIRKKYAVEFTSERTEGKTKGKKIAGNKDVQKFAKRMILDGLPLQKISRMTQLSIEIVQKLAAEVETSFDQDT